MVAISLIYAAAPHPPVSVADCRRVGLLEVFEIAPPGRALLSSQASVAGLPYRSIGLDQGLTRALNLAMSWCSGDWVLFLFGDQQADLSRAELSETLAGTEACAVLFAPLKGLGLPVCALRRKAFVYGAFDERFPSGRASILHWLHRIFPQARRRCAPCEGVRTLAVDWVAGSLPVCDHPASALVELWGALDPSGRAALLAASLADPEQVRGDFARLLDTQARLATEAAADPYRTGAYAPRDFWERNTEGYVKWETYQPDEPEIMEMVELAAPRSVLELGCGAGRNIRYFRGAERYLGLDISTNLLARAKARLEENGAGLACADIVDLCAPSGHFDLVFSDSTIQHVEPSRIKRCVAEMVRVSSRYVGIIEFTDELEDEGTWFEQTHMFRHDYEALFAPHCALVYRKEAGYSVQPAVKQVFLFEKRAR